MDALGAHAAIGTHGNLRRYHFASKLRTYPGFKTTGMTLLKRLTQVIDDGIIEHVFYPVFPPERNAVDVLAWLKQHSD